jgi:ligand-binding sensor domain-containing protein
MIKSAAYTYRLLILPFLMVVLLADKSWSGSKIGWVQYYGNQSFRCVASRGDECWIGNYGSGVYRLNVKTSEIINYTNVNSGLPSNLVSDIAIGPDNVVWIATACGLATFDGNSWNVFTMNNSPFVSNNISAVDIDRSGDVWVSLSGGFCCRRSSEWIDITERYPGFPLELLSGTTKLSCAGTEVWLQFLNSAVCFDNGTWGRINEINSALYVGKDGTRWFMSTNNKSLTGLKGDTIRSIPVQQSYLWGSFFIDSSDVKWVYKSDTLACYRDDKWVTVTVPQEYRTGVSFSFVEVDDAGMIWFSGNEHFLRYNPATDMWQPYYYRSNNSDHRYSSIQKLIVDAGKNIWVLNGGGCYHLDSGTWTLSEQFSSVHAVDIKLDKQGRINAAGYTNYAAAEMILHAAMKSDLLPGGSWSATQCTVKGDVCNLTCLDPVRNIWFFSTYTYRGGNHMYAMENGQCSEITYPGEDTTKRVIALDIAENGTVWALIGSQELFRYQNGKWEKKQLDDKVPVNDTVMGIKGGRGDTLWIVTKKAGIGRFDGSQWKLFETGIDASSFLDPLHYDSKKGELWCRINRRTLMYDIYSMAIVHRYRGDGLYCFNGSTGKIFTTANSGMIDSEIKAVASDSDGFWVASAYGLAYCKSGQLSASALNPVAAHSMQQKQGCFKVQTLNKKLELYLDSPEFISISIFTLTGQLVRTIDAGKRSAGYNQIPLTDFGNDCRARNLYIISVNIRGGT